MSHWEPESQLGRFNKAVPGEWRDLPPGFFDVLCCALAVAEASDGAYDPTIGALVDLWGFGPAPAPQDAPRSDEHTSALQSPMRTSYAVFCLKKKKKIKNNTNIRTTRHTLSNQTHYKSQIRRADTTVTH